MGYLLPTHLRHHHPLCRHVRLVNLPEDDLHQLPVSPALLFAKLNVKPFVTVPLSATHRLALLNRSTHLLYQMTTTE